jgi:hypothetical protein
MISKLIDLVAERALEAAHLVRRFVVPVFGREPNGNLYTEGSGLLLRIGRRYFLISAGHVFDRTRHPVYLLGKHDENLRLVERAETTIDPAAQQPGQTMDLGYLQLARSEAETMGLENFLQPSNLIPRDAAAPRRWYLATGYPDKYQQRDLGRRLFRLQDIYYGSVEVRDPIYSRLGLSRDLHILIRFDRRTIETPTSFGAPPSFRGMSGGGVWRLNPLEQYREDNKPMLAGIIIEQPARHKKVLLAHRIELVLAGIRQQYPELRDEIPPSPLVTVRVQGGWRNQP